jgi:hypothetical protein
LSKRQRDYGFEKLVIEYIRKLIRTTDEMERVELFAKFKREIESLVQSPEDRIVLKYFDFIHWADQKMTSATVVNRAI